MIVYTVDHYSPAKIHHKPTRAPPALPADLLYDIFQLVIQNDTFTGLEMAQSPWNLAAVCKNWRSICITSPKLWTRFHLNNHRCRLTGTFDDNQVCVNGLSLRRCYIQLERSKDLPLSVDSRTFETRSCKRSILRTIAGQRHRWNALRFDAEAKALEDFPKLILYKENLHRLHSLQYHCRTTSLLGFSLPFGATSLTSLVSLHILYWGGTVTSVVPTQFPWSQLQNLYLDGYSGKGNAVSLLTVLSLSTSLVAFKLQTRDLSFSKDTEEFDLTKFPPDSIILHHLTHLDFDIRTPDSLYHLLPYIRTPALDVIFLGPLSNYDIQVVTDLVKRSGCKPTCLDMAFVYRPSFEQLLQRLDNLEELAIHGWEDTSEEDASDCNEVLAPLLRVEGSPFFHPRLRRLSISNLQFDPDLLVHVVESRLSTVPEREERIPLTVLEMCYFPKENNSTLFGFYKTMLRDRLSQYESGAFMLVFDPKAFNSRNRLQRRF